MHFSLLSRRMYFRKSAANSFHITKRNMSRRNKPPGKRDKDDLLSAYNRHTKHRNKIEKRSQHIAIYSCRSFASKLSIAELLFMALLCRFLWKPNPLAMGETHTTVTSSRPAAGTLMPRALAAGATEGSITAGYGRGETIMNMADVRSRDLHEAISAFLS